MRILDAGKLFLKKSWRTIALLSVLIFLVVMLLIPHFKPSPVHHRPLTLEEQLALCDVMMNPNATEEERERASLDIAMISASQYHSNPQVLNEKMSELLHYLTTTEIAYSGRDPMHEFSMVEEAMYQSVLKLCDKKTYRLSWIYSPSFKMVATQRT